MTRASEMIKSALEYRELGMSVIPVAADKKPLIEKRCIKCMCIKPLSEFYVNKSRPKGSSDCKKCRSVYAKKNYNKETKSAYSKANRPLINATRNKIRVRNKEKKYRWLLEHYGTDRLRCDKCRYNKSFVALQAHHTKPHQKENKHDSLSFWMGEGYSFKRFIQKILETDFVFLCANCHAELHSEERTWKIK